MEKKHWIMLIAGLVAIYLVWYFLLRKKSGTESSYSKSSSMCKTCLATGQAPPPAPPGTIICTKWGYINCANGSTQIK